MKYKMVKLNGVANCNWFGTVLNLKLTIILILFCPWDKCGSDMTDSSSLPFWSMHVASVLSHSNMKAVLQIFKTLAYAFHLLLS